ncbi:MAG: glycosyltransferase family 2 protein [Anaerolineae bacterium]|nr:glycosyltransferase family 2 protein [Anaerolineae bacterium]
MDLSIIIVNWNTRDLLAQCLASVLADIQASPHLQVETLVVDNASTDDSVRMLQEQFPWVQLIENKKNAGFASANNQAICHSTGRYVLLLNPDTTVKPGTLTILHRFMDTHPQVGAIGARLLNPDGTLQTSCYPTPTLSRELWRLFHLDVVRPYGVYRMNDWDLAIPHQVQVIQGAALMLRRKALNQVGLLDDKYFMYTEEVDLCHRIQTAGWLLYWVPQAQVVHYGGQSTQQIAAEMFLCLYQSKLIFIRKHYGRLSGLVYKFILTAATLARLLLAPLAWLEQNPKRQQHLTTAGHYCRLLVALPKI